MTDFDKQFIKDYSINFAVATPAIVGAIIYIVANDKQKAAKQIVMQLIPSMLVGGVIGSWYGSKKLEDFKTNLKKNN